MLDKNAALMKCKEILQCQCCKETLKCRQFLEDYLHSMRSSWGVSNYLAGQEIPYSFFGKPEGPLQCTQSLPS